jgi:fluoroacetyl-CoA thioesterase
MAVQTFEHTVTEGDTAAVLGSGDLAVLATPRLINWLERAAYAVAKASCPAGQTSVGTLVKVEHLNASPVGAVVTCTCSKPISDGRRLIFHVKAVDDAGEQVAVGEMHRRLVDPQRFMTRFVEAAEAAAAPATPAE